MAKNVVELSVADREARAKQIWDDLVGDLHEIIVLFGGLLLLPVFMFIGLGYGLRAGIITGVEKALEMLKAWWEWEK